MSFKLFHDRIKTSNISLEEAVKKAQSAKPTPVPSLDDLLSRLDAENKGIKTASSVHNMVVLDALILSHLGQAHFG